MNKQTFIERLRETAELLEPYTRFASPGTKHWDGTAYVESETTHFEPQALAWWSSLTAIAEMIDNQDTPLTEKQRAYLDGLLFGGMGSLNDLSISANTSGKDAKSINAKLDRQRRRLFASFKGGDKRKRAALASGFATLLALPALFEQTWLHEFTAIGITLLNLPGILLMGRFFPSEGFPGQSPVRFALMLAVQIVLWYLILTFLRRRKVP